MIDRNKRLAFCLFKFFPYGGLQRKMLSIAAVCRQRGYQIDIYTRSWEGEMPVNLNVQLIASGGWSNHAKNESFSNGVQSRLKAGEYDAIVGFNRMPGLDVYYAADACYVERIRRTKSWLYRLTPRYRHFSSYEKQVFHAESHTRVMVLSGAEQARFIKWYGTPVERFRVLPPGISRDRMAPANAAEVRSQWRREFGFDQSRLVVLMVGSNFRGKGLGRLLRGTAALPEDVRSRVHLIMIGKDNPDPFYQLAAELNLSSHLSIYPGREDVPRFYLGSDLFAHPADIGETAGNVILEAVVSGLPVLVTESCGYAEHVAQADAGILVPVPYRQQDFNAKLLQMLTSVRRPEWAGNGIEYGRSRDLYSLPDAAADIIDQVVEQKMRPESPPGPGS